MTKQTNWEVKSEGFVKELAHNKASETQRNIKPNRNHWIFPKSAQPNQKWLFPNPKHDSAYKNKKHRIKPLLFCALGCFQFLSWSEQAVQKMFPAKFVL